MSESEPVYVSDEVIEACGGEDAFLEALHEDVCQRLAAEVKRRIDEAAGRER